MFRAIKMPSVFLITLCSSLCFTSCDKKPSGSVVTTDAVTAITQTTAISGGNVVSDGNSKVTAKGVCWGTEPAPTTANSKTSDGSGTGSFTSSISGLSAGNIYYIRAYATNNAGTSYGSAVQFATRAAGDNILTIEGTSTVNTISGEWAGVNISRKLPTIFTYRNNYISSVNSAGYMLQAGDEAPLPTNNNLDGKVITGNKFVWNGINSPAIITHGLFVGYNINSVVKYNYLENVPYGIIFKSGTDAGVNMTFTSGGCAYNICKNGKFAGRIKGINGVKFYNNTFYSGDGSGFYLILITENMDRAIPSPSTGTKIFNNIFYSTRQIPMIKIETGCLTGFESDYNVYWCTAGEPTFDIDGISHTWAQWRAHGYDTHSVIINPDFIDTNDFVPRVRLDNGKNLGAEWQAGLSTTARWVVGQSPATKNQNGIWQVGARVY